MKNVTALPVLVFCLMQGTADGLPAAVQGLPGEVIRLWPMGNPDGWAREDANRKPARTREEPSAIKGQLS